MNAATEFDLGPLTWVKGEIDAALDRAGEALGQYREGKDATQLKFCRTHVHQVHGALAIVGLDGVTQVTEALESLLSAMEDGKAAIDEAGLNAVGQALVALRQYLDDLMAGEPNQPLRLLPIYKELSVARGSDRLRPSDLFFPDLTVRPPKRTEPMVRLSPDEFRKCLKTERMRFQKGLLAWLKNPPGSPAAADGLEKMQGALKAIEATQETPAARSFWWVSQGFLNALNDSGIASEQDAKQLCARIDLQIRRLLEGSRNVAERLMRDALYFVGQAPVDGKGLAAKIRDDFQLQHLIPEVSAAPTSAPQEAALRRLRETIVATEEFWNKFCAGSAAALSGFVEQAKNCAPLTASVGHTDLKRLGQGLAAIATWLGEDPSRQSEVVAMEVATAILLLQNAQENFKRLGTDFARQVDLMVARLHACISGTALAADDQEVPLLDEMSRRAQEKLLITQVAREIQNNLAQIEQALDTFFRDPAQGFDAAALAGPLKQIAGALTILGHDKALRSLEECGQQIKLFGEPGYAPFDEDFESVAQQLSTLGFFVDALQTGTTDYEAFMRKLRGEEPPQQDDESEEISSEEAPASSVEAELEQKKGDTHALLAALKEAPEDERLKNELKQNLQELQVDADLVADHALGETAKAALSALESGAAATPELDAALIVSLKPTAAEAPAPSAETLKLAEASHEEIDAELLEIFLEEAHEVVGAIATELENLKAQPHDVDTLTNIRRSMHTLKGSGRMVGLKDLGEVAWSVEQTLNMWLRQEIDVTPDILEMIGLAHGVFSVWVHELAENTGNAPDATALVALADGLRAIESSTAAEAAPKPEPAPPLTPAAEPAVVSEIEPEETPAALAELAPEQEAAGETAEAAVSEAAAQQDVVWEQAASEEIAPAEAAATDAITPEFGTESLTHPAIDFDFSLDLPAESHEPALEKAAIEAFPEIQNEQEIVLADLPDAESVTETEAVEEEIEFNLGELAEGESEISFEEVAPELPETTVEATESSNFPTIEMPVDQVSPPARAAELAEGFEESGLTAEHSEILPASDAAAIDFDISTGEEHPLDADLLVEKTPDLEVSQPETSAAEHLLNKAEALDFASSTPGTLETATEEIQAIEIAEAPLDDSVASEQVAAIDAHPAPAPLLETQTGECEAIAEESSGELGGVSPTLYDIFREEARGHLEMLEKSYRELEASPKEPTTFAMTRAAHTLGGIAATVGLMPINKLAIGLEHALLRRDNSVQPDSIQGVEIVRQTILALQDMFAGLANQIPPEAEPVLLEALEEIFPLPTPQLESVDETNPPLAPTASVAVEDIAALPSLDTELETAANLAIRMQDTPHLKDELDDQLLPIFLEEAQDLVQGFAEQLRIWRQNPMDAEPPRALARLLHTFKGGARMAGAMNLGELTHTLEASLEDALRAGSLSLPLLEQIENGCDTLTLIVERLFAGESPILPVVPAETPQIVMTTVTETPAGTAAPDHEEAPFVHVPAAEPEVADRRAQLRVRADLVDRLVNEAGEMSIARARIEGEMRSLKASLLDLTENVIRLRRQLREIEIQSEGQIQARVAQASDGQAEFDPLELDRFTRFQELTRFMAESVNDVATVQQNLLKNLDDANAAIIAQARMNRALQQDLMGIRMVPFVSQSERLYRIVRQTGKELSKRANLDIRGGHVEFDRSVLDKIMAPVEHMLRNAVGHGIESRDARIAAGKPEVGEITLALTQEGNEIVVAMADDGRGLDAPKIRARAESLGMLAPGEPMEDTQLYNFIFRPGFSTAAEVTQIAGRGVGMDVVKSEVTSLGGRIEIVSAPGKGTTFRLYLPLTLAVTQTLLVHAAGVAYAIPATMIEQVLELKDTGLAEIRGNGEAQWLGNRYPFHFLPHLLGNSNALPESRRRYWVLLLRSGAQRVAIQVDELNGNQEVVVKNIGAQLSRVVGIAGATVLGDGRVVLILNPIALASRSPAVSTKTAGPAAVQLAQAPEAPEPETQKAATLPTVMVVDDSLTVRKITGRLLAREGYQVITAKDGVDALEHLIETIPDVLLSDIEMPRMDGFDLVRNIRADARLQELPIIMITSRTADKHRNYAIEIGANEYLGKPYDEDTLLGLISGFIKQKRGS
ncbi:MAG: Hpt domain-containing protein [Betaproteobacteria bacterium]